MKFISRCEGSPVVQVVAQQNLLTLAQQGDPSAIATLINQVLWKKGMTAIAKTKGSCLHIVLVAAQVPDPPSCVRFIADGVGRLQPKSIRSVRLYGRRSDQKWPAWTEAFDLRPKFPATPARTRLVRPTAAPETPRKAAKLKTHYKKRVPLLFLGSIIWVMVAALGVVVSYQLNPPLPSTSQTEKPEESLERLLSTSANQRASQPTARTRQSVGQLTPFTSPPPQATPQTPTPQPINGTQTPAPVAPPPPVTPKAASSITLKAVGDIVPGTNFPNNRLPSDKQKLFQNIKPSLQGADILFGNFESTFTDQPRPAKDTSRSMVFAFRTPPSYVNLFKEVGFHVLSIANNHSFDFFAAGFEDTHKHIAKAGMKPVGKKNEIVYMNVKNIPVAFIGFSHLEQHNSVNNIEAAKALVIEAKKKAEIVVISVHAGAEGTDAMRVRNKQEMFYGENRGNKVLFARTMIDNGADLVLGHGPHVPRAMELYKGKLIAYSLGNFIGYRTLSTRGPLGQSLILEVKLNPKGDFMSGKIIPVQLDKQGIPRLDNQFRSVQLIRNLTKMDFPDTPLVIDDKGQILKKP